MTRGAGGEPAGRQSRERAPRGSITRERVVTMALEIIDERGLEKLTMSTLAQELDVGTMSLYRHVANKAELVQAAADRVLATVEIPRTGGDDWQDLVVGYLLEWRARALAHPAIASIIAERALALPAATDDLEELLGVLCDAGFADDEAVRAFYTLFSYVLGFVVWELPRSGDTYHDNWDAALAGLPRGPYRTLHSLQQWLHTTASEEQFQYGLRHLVDTLDRSRLQQS